MYFRYSIVIPRFILRAKLLNPNNHYNYSFHDILYYNHLFIVTIYCAQWFLVLTYYTLMIICDIIVTMKIKGPYNI